MARHTGVNGIVKKGGLAVGGMRNWSIDETIPITPLAAAGDDYTPKATGIRDWTGSVEFLFDPDEPAQNVRAGDRFDAEFFSETDAVGKQFRSGSIIVSSVGVRSPYDAEVMVTVSFEGNSVLTVGPVT